MKLKAPLCVFLELTAACNLRCIHCYFASTGRPNEFSTEETLKLIDEIARENVMMITFTGGEPFCKKDVTKILQYSVDCGIWTNVFTNGTLLKGALLEKVCRMDLSSIQTTLFSHKPAVHDSIVGKPGAFEEVVYAVKALTDAGLSVTTNTPVLEENISDIPPLFEFVSTLGVKKFGIFPALPFGRGEDRVKRSRMSELYLEAAINIYKAKQDLKNSAMKLDGVIGRAVEKAKGPPRTIADIFNGSSCGAARGSITVTSDGNVLPCTIFSACPEVSVGNVRETPLFEIWRNAPSLQRLRENEQSNKVCSRCSRRKECPRCIAEVYSMYGTFDAPDPRCPQAKIFEKVRA
jgi:radical SAM protein with 4Fe4S-binding SPASM domain